MSMRCADIKMRIFYDVDTQNDFMNKDGALYVPDAELIKPNSKLLTDFARENLIPILGSVDKHFGILEYKDREGELQKWGGPFPKHCMANTKGQEKISETVWKTDLGWGEYRNLNMFIPHKLNNRVHFKDINWNWNLVKNKQIYFEKQSYDVFTNPSFPAFLDMAGVREAVVYGVATDYCVKATVLGMQKKGIQCYVVEDAIKGVAPDTTKAALNEMAEAEAKLITTKGVLEGKLG